MIELNEDMLGEDCLLARAMIRDHAANIRSGILKWEPRPMPPQFGRTALEIVRDHAKLTNP